MKLKNLQSTETRMLQDCILILATKVNGGKKSVRTVLTRGETVLTKNIMRETVLTKKSVIIRETVLTKKTMKETVLTRKSVIAETVLTTKSVRGETVLTRGRQMRSRSRDNHYWNRL